MIINVLMGLGLIVNELLHPNWVCDNAPVTQALDWTPQIPLAEGLRHLFTSDSLS